MDEVVSHVSTATLDKAASREWDVIVVGAGPAGALAAREAARRGLRVLLVDKASFPRWKVCGCCINLRAVSVLSAVGLEGLLESRGAVPLRHFQLAAVGRTARVGLPGGFTLSRSAFDAGLVAAACDAGAVFLPGTTAKFFQSAASHRQIALRRGDTSAIVQAAVAVAADGLAGRLLKTEGFASPASEGSRVGAGAITDNAGDRYERGTIYMACARGGYVGLVRIEDGRLNIAAAFESGLIKACGGLGAAAASVLREAGLPPVADLEELPWRGTPALTRRATRVAASRAFVVGDAAGYVEPFTGEGMAWALSSAAALAPLLELAVRAYNPELENDWDRLHRRLVGERQAVCRLMAASLRRPRLVRAAVAVMSAFPAVARPFVRRINLPLEQKGLASP